MTLTVCASSSSSAQSQSPLDTFSNLAMMSDSKSTSDIIIEKVPPQSDAKEIRLNITLNSDDSEKETVDVDMGK